MAVTIEDLRYRANQLLDALDMYAQFVRVWSEEDETVPDEVELARRDAIDAIEHTVPGNHVNLVTHAELGHPEEFLYEHLDGEYDDDIEWEYVDQSGCGGHITRVYV